MILIKNSLKDLVLFITKELVPLSFVELPFLGRLILGYNLHVKFPLRCTLMHETLPNLDEKTKEKFIVQSLKSCDICMMSFDL
jgi:uncharacterized membrane protein YqhA